MTSNEEDIADKLRHELEAGQDIESVLRRIKDSWTPAMAQSTAGQALYSAMSSAPATKAKTEAKEAYLAKLREAGIAEVMQRWWSYPPLAAAADAVDLSFIDAAGEIERWAPELIPCSLSEPFGRVAQRFRVTVNKRYRHPFLPSRHFDLLLDGDQRTSFDSLEPRTVADVVADKREIRYVRNDNAQAQRVEEEKSPSKKVAPWDRARLLPSWCTTPDAWLEPAPPPGFVVSKIEGEQYYVKVPTIHFPFACMRSAALQPQLIARSLYLPVKDAALTNQITLLVPDNEEDHVPVQNRLVPSALSVDAARSLLGRFVQSSTQPLRGDAPPSQKKRKKLSVNKFETQTVAMAWGLSLDQDGKPDWLHCARLAFNWQYDIVLDLKGGLNRRFGHARVTHMNCAWVGAIEFDADKRAAKSARAEDGEKKQEQESFAEWSQKARRWIENLNKERADKLVQIGQEGTFLAGDVEMAKGDNDEFELAITGAKPGVWRMSVSAPSIVQFGWIREGTVDYDALPPTDGTLLQPAEDDGIEELGKFTVDSGRAGLFSQSAFDALTFEGDRQAKIETLIDARMDGQGDEVYVPSGVVVDGDDGTYLVEGTKDESGRIITIRMRPWEME